MVLAPIELIFLWGNRPPPMNDYISGHIISTMIRVGKDKLGSKEKIHSIYFLYFFLMKKFYWSTIALQSLFSLDSCHLFSRWSWPLGCRARMEADHCIQSHSVPWWTAWGIAALAARSRWSAVGGAAKGVPRRAAILRLDQLSKRRMGQARARGWISRAVCLEKSEWF